MLITILNEIIYIYITGLSNFNLYNPLCDREYQYSLDFYIDLGGAIPGSDQGSLLVGLWAPYVELQIEPSWPHSTVSLPTILQAGPYPLLFSMDKKTLSRYYAVLREEDQSCILVIRLQNVFCSILLGKLRFCGIFLAAHTVLNYFLFSCLMMSHKYFCNKEIHA